MVLVLLSLWCHRHVKQYRCLNGLRIGTVLCLLCVCVTLPPPASAGPHLRVMTYNVAGGSVNQRLPLELMLRQRPDLVLLQEVRGAAHVEWLGQHLGLAYWRFAPYRQQRGGVAILSRWPLGPAHVLPWHNSPEGRLAVAAQVESPAGRFWACSAHLDNPFPRKAFPTLWHKVLVLWREFFTTTQRTQEAQALSAWLLHLGGDDGIIGGDFNSLPLARADRHLRQYFEDALSTHWRQYFTGTYWALRRSPLRPRIDFVYHSPRWQVVEAQVIQHKASDHFPVLAVFSPPVKESEALAPLYDQEPLSGLARHWL